MSKIWIVKVDRETAEDNFIESAWDSIEWAEARKNLILNAEIDDVTRVSIEGFEVNKSSELLDD